MAISGRLRQNNKHKPFSDINITPMVDVMLVLLIVFMITAPMLQSGVSVELPEGGLEALAHNDETPLAITITAEGSLFLQSDEVSRDQLEVALKSIMNERKSDKIFLRADGQNSYSTVFDIIGYLSTIGYNNVSLVGDIPTGS